MNNNLMWYLLAAGVLVLLAVMWINNPVEVVIPYSDLISLVKQKTPDEPFKGHITVQENGVAVRYSDLKEPHLGNTQGHRQDHSRGRRQK